MPYTGRYFHYMNIVTVIEYHKNMPILIIMQNIILTIVQDIYRVFMLLLSSKVKTRSRITDDSHSFPKSSISQNPNNSPETCTLYRKERAENGQEKKKNIGCLRKCRCGLLCTNTNPNARFLNSHCPRLSLPIVLYSQHCTKCSRKTLHYRNINQSKHQFNHQFMFPPLVIVFLCF